MPVRFINSGQEWLFKSLLDIIIKPMMPVLIFFAWIIASIVLVIGFLRRFSDNKGIEKISFCALIAFGADWISRTGWGIFVHGYAKNSFRSLPFPSKPIGKKPELASIEIRDFAYRKLIELAPATNSKEIIDGPEGLRA